MFNGKDRSFVRGRDVWCLKTCEHALELRRGELAAQITCRDCWHLHAEFTTLDKLSTRGSPMASKINAHSNEVLSDVLSRRSWKPSFGSPKFQTMKPRGRKLMSTLQLPLEWLLCDCELQDFPRSKLKFPFLPSHAGRQEPEGWSFPYLLFAGDHWNSFREINANHAHNTLFISRPEQFRAF